MENTILNVVDKLTKILGPPNDSLPSGSGEWAIWIVDTYSRSPYILVTNSPKNGPRVAFVTTSGVVNRRDLNLDLIKGQWEAFCANGDIPSLMKRTTYGIYVNGIHVDIIESAWPAHRVMKTQRRRFPNAKQLSVKSIIGGVDDKEEALKDVDSKILVDVLGVD